MESFFHTLKTQLVHHRRYATRREATPAKQAFSLASLLREPGDQGLDIDHAAKHLIEHVLVSFGGVLIDHRDHDPQLLRLRGEGGKTSDKLAVIHVSHAFRVPWRATGSQPKGGRKEVKGKKCVDGAVCD